MLLKKSALFLCILMLSKVIYSEELAPGIFYTHLKKSNPYPLSLHIVEIKNDVAKFVLQPAKGNGCSREPVSSIGKRKDALLAVNTGNYRRGGQFNGNPVGYLEIKDKVYADPAIARTFLGVTQDQEVVIDQPTSHWRLKLGKDEFSVDKVNQPRGENDAIIYNHAFGKTTLTSNEGIEIAVSGGKILSINKHKGNTKIPKNGFVYSVGKSLPINLDVVSLNMSAGLEHTLESANETSLSNIEYAVSGAGLLIRDGKIIEDFHEDLKLGIPIIHSGDERAADFHNDKERGSLVEDRHPRTALGIKEDKTLIIFVVDGRQPGVSEGMSFKELAEYLYSLGCIQAINLGGGGCTTLYIKDHGVVNTPAVLRDPDHINTSNSNERPVSDALLVFSNQ